MKKEIFTGSGVAIITPMNQDGSINYAELEKLIEFQIQNGTDAIITCGTTGESATMSHEEHCEVIRFTIEKVNKRVPVIAGTGSNDTAKAIAHTKKAAALGADAALVVTPYYNKATQKGLAAFFFAIADSSPIPLILYNVPSRTGVNIQPETYALMAEHPNIVGIKEANGDISSVARTLSLVGDRLDLYSGNDDQIVPILSLGGKGVISVLSNPFPRETAEITGRFFKGDIQGAAQLQLHFLPLISALFSEVNPIPVKAAMSALGYGENRLRLPLTEMEEEHKEKLLALMKKEGVLR